MDQPSVPKLRDELCEYFGSALTSDEALLAECVSICQMFALPAQDLFFKWEAANFNSKAAFTLAAARDLKAQIQREKERLAESQRRARANLAGALRSAPRGGGAGILNIGARYGGGGVGMPVKAELGQGERRKALVAGPSRVKYEGPQMSEEARRGRAYRYMYEKASERSEILDDRIEEFAEIVKNHYNIDDFSDPAATSEEETYIVGRVVLDSESSSSGAVKLNEASLALESSRIMGSGVRVSLKFDAQTKIRGGAEGASGLGLFPGAIAAFRGKNGGGGWFLVSEILSLPPMKPKALTKTDLDGSPFSMVIASGPFTPDADLSYKPWRALLEKLKMSKPSVVLLLGPFVDASHPCVKDGDVDETPEDMFRSVFVDNLRDFLDLNPGAIALLVPSVRDIISDHVVFPQGELSARLVDDPRIHMLSNPCIFTMGLHSFRVTSVDVLFHLRKEEFIKRGEEIESTSIAGDDPGSDSMGGLCRHILRQRSFYPVFPTPLDLAHEVNLDVSHFDGLALAYNAEDPPPDVLVLPSRYKHFSKVVDGTTAINPSFATKGMYTSVTLASHKGSSARDNVKVEFLRFGD